MPPQAFDPANTVNTIKPMDPHQHHNNMNMNQQAHMYSYSAYAPPAYNGHTGYTQPAFAPPPPAACAPNGAGMAMGWTAYYQQVPPQGQPGAQPVQQQQQQQQAAPAQQTYEIILPHHNDVLMGRGGKNNQHKGNENLRDMARDVRERYKASAKKGKSNMSRELVQKVRELDPPGRFLKRNPVTSEWEDVGDEIAREKVSQVLRDAVSEWTGPKSQAKAAAAGKEEGQEISAEPPKLEKTAAKRKSSPAASRESSPAPRAPPRRVSAAGVRSRSTSPSKAIAAATSSSAEQPIVASAAAAPLPVIAVPGIATRAVTVTDAPEAAVSEVPVTSTAPLKDEPKQPTIFKEEEDAALPPINVPMRARSNTAESEISFGDDMDPIEELDLPGDLDNDSVLNDDSLSLDDSASQAASVTSSGRRRSFRMQPVGHVPFTSFRTKARNRLDRYSNMSLGVSSSDMSISSQLSSRNLGTQLSGRQLVSTGTRQMSSRQLSQRQLSSRQLSSRQLSSRQLSSRQLSSRQLSSRQLSSRQLSSRQLSRRGLLSSNMMGESELSLDSLNISGHSKQLSRKNVFMQQYVDMDMGLSDFSVGSFMENPTAGIGEEDNANLFHESRVSVILEGDMEEFSEHTNANDDPIEIKPAQLLDMYSSGGVGTSFSNMTIGTFSGHSRMSRGISSRGFYGTGSSMRLESGHSFIGNDLQLDMLDDELFDEYDYMDDQDEFSSDFC